MSIPSDELLRETRQLLLDRGAELRDRVQRVRQDLGRKREPLPRDSDDAAIVLENDEILQAIEKSAVGELGLIDVALRRLDEGTFAVCEKCGGQIEPKRLEAVPYSSLCRSCAWKS
jgi:RNA polymerase-binding transcription factor